MSEILTLTEAARFLRLAPVTLYRKARRGEIPAAKVGKGWRFHRPQLEGWLHHLSQRSEQNSSDSFRHLSSRETQGVIDFLALLKYRFPSFLGRVILYGSRARGDLKAHSDIDLLVTVRGEAGSVQTIRREIKESAVTFNREHRLTLQVVVLPEAEWIQPSFRTFLLIEQVKREGIPLG